MDKNSHRSPRPEGELDQRLTEQIGFLESSAVAYDEGRESEYQRIAATIRLLVHDGGQSKSLMGQIGTKSTKGFVSIAFPSEKINWRYGYNRLILNFANGQEAIASAYLDGAVGMSYYYDKRFVSFSQWWGDTVCRTSDGKTFTRGQLVLAVANQDGGAHVDPGLDPSFAALLRTNTLSITLCEGLEVKNQVAASIRHIGHELLKTLQPGYRKVNRDLRGFTPSPGQKGPSVAMPGCPPVFRKDMRMKVFNRDK